MNSARQTFRPSEISYYRQASATRLQFQGLSVMKHEKSIRKLISDTMGKSINPRRVRVLDYGCGCGQQWTHHNFHDKLGISAPAMYDPGVNGLEKKPEGTFSGVICSDVMEHVPEDLVPSVLEELFAYAERFIWLSVCCRPAKKKFPDGRNLHLTVQPEEWWRERIQVAALAAPRKVAVCLVFTE